MTYIYSAEENNTQSKLAIMTTLPSAKETEIVSPPSLYTMTFFSGLPLIVK